MKFFVGIWQRGQIEYVPSRFVYSYRRARTNHKSLRPLVTKKEWMLDSGGFSELSQKGRYTYSPQEYFNAVLVLKPNFWCSMDWMCEPSIRKITGKKVEEHLTLTTDNHRLLKESSEKNGLESNFVGVIQGYQKSDYLAHIDMLKDAGLIERYMGIGTLCRRQANPEIVEIINTIKRELPSSVRLHGFGLKTTALQNPFLISLLYSCDSMAWSYVGRRTEKSKDQKICLVNSQIRCHSKAKNCANCPVFMREWAIKIETLIIKSQKQMIL